ncbi:MAG: hypothetical protein FJY07_13250, partial [Bacteroidetes bacterium]|nr:hypothetical protein [Bacteroidota bacterium]
GNYTKTLQIYDSCLALVKTSDYHEILSLLYYNISKTHELEGSWKQAFQFLMLHHTLKDSIFNIENRRSMKDLELAYEKEKNEAKILALHNESLRKDYTIRQRTNQRNIYIYAALMIIIGGSLFITVLVTRWKKNKMRLEQRLRQTEDEKKLLAARGLVEGQEQERKRIATDLHDSLGILLSSARLHFSNIIDKAPEHKELLDKANHLMEMAAKDVRKISHNMMPIVLTKLGLIEAVESLLEPFEHNSEISASLNIKGTPVRLPENAEIMLYRIIQELINNTVKHAEAKNIALNFLFDSHLKILYSDDGKGFNVFEVIEEGSFGLKSIISRVGFLEGDATLESKPGMGFTAFINVPLVIHREDLESEPGYRPET